MKTKKPLWKLWIPVCGDDDIEFSKQTHKLWNEAVCKIVCPLVKMDTAQSLMVEMQKEAPQKEMIPAQVYCSYETISKIVQLTLDHYGVSVVKWNQAGKSATFSYKSA